MPARPDRQALGAAAEAAALRHLEAAGLVLLARNARFKVGELDLVMRDGDTVVFVEVRLRNATHFGDGFASVDRRKRQRMVRAAQAWLAARPALARHPCRLDVVSARAEDGAHALDWQRDAFTLADV
ncbi:MAG TPA: YraN family protein [Arenimonas sp.]|uniref:YraN family protein n=1 Tax=Arenimonas sp. TaxID=1872635 RepID=UPI002D80C2C1|nr:YraN family protein [Arenimonas sp.]HEU0154286.1 YraN family protein [Arenimonas sp.]